MGTFFISTLVVGLAEIGDKSLFLTLLLTLRYQRPWPVFNGLLAGVTANLALAALAGVWLAAWLDNEWLPIALGVGFILMALWALLPEDDQEPLPDRSHGSIFLTAAVGFFLLEMADKTQLATLALAARFETVIPVLAGGVTGVVLANAPAIWLGNRFAGRLPVRNIRIGAATLFALLGVWILLDVLR